VEKLVVDVTAVNDQPEASDNLYRVTEDKVLTVRPPGVLGNDTDPDGDALTASLVSGPQKGRLTRNADGSFAYKPNRNFHGTDSFVYESRDGQGGTDIAKVTIMVRSRPG
jgi:hypothetical protein